MSERMPRDASNTRESEKREHNPQRRRWKPASLLPELTPEAGYGTRWIRTSVLGQADHMNFSSKSAEGWEPMKLADHPEAKVAASPSGNIELGGLIACKMPLDMLEDREQWFGKINKQSMEAVDSQLMKENDPRMPMFSERSSTTSRTR